MGLFVARSIVCVAFKTRERVFVDTSTDISFSGFFVGKKAGENGGLYS